MRAHSLRAFTLIELLLSVALISIVFGTTVVLYQNVADQTDLDTATQAARELLLEASRYAAASYDDSPWGVHFETGEALLFKGDSYASRDITFDERVDLYTIMVSGASEYVFEKKNRLSCRGGRDHLHRALDRREQKYRHQ